MTPIWRRRLPGLNGAVWGLILGLPFAVLVPLVSEPLLRFWIGVVMWLCALIYGRRRVTRSHPAHNQAYREWLTRTPWRWPQPLPYRSPSLSIDEAAFVLVLAALCPWGFLAGLLLSGSGFLTGYAGAITSRSIDDGGVMGRGLVALIGLTIACFVGPNGPSWWSAIIAVAVVAPLSQVSLRYGLKRFSEDLLSCDRPAPKEDKIVGSPYRELLQGLEPTEQKHAGWIPLVVSVLYLTACAGFCWRRANAWSALVDPEAALELEPLGVLVYYGREAYDTAAPVQANVVVLAGLFLFFHPLILTPLTHWGSNRAPISLLGRIATGRLVIPGYDVYLLGMLVAPVAYAAAVYLLVWLSFSPVAAGGLGLALALVVYDRLTPTDREWRLTGHHRIVLGPPSSARKQSANRPPTPGAA